MSRGNRACRRGCHDNATRKLLPRNIKLYGVERLRATQRNASGVNKPLAYNKPSDVQLHNVTGQAFIGLELTMLIFIAFCA